MCGCVCVYVCVSESVCVQTYIVRMYIFQDLFLISISKLVAMSYICYTHTHTRILCAA